MSVPSQRPAGRKVLFMATCLCDAFFDNAARAAVEVLEHAGCEVIFPEDQTCCGQPAFNSGNWPACRKVMRHAAEVFNGDLPVVTPSGSCAAMLFHGAGIAFEGEPDREVIGQLAGRAWELADFLVNGLGVPSWPGRFPARVAFHQACHTRGTASGPAALRLLGMVEGVEVTPFGEGDQCCGFGGTFSVGFPHVSTSMGQLKLDHVRKATPDFLVSGDMSCLLHLGGLAGKEPGGAVPTLHLAEVLQKALRDDG